MCSWCVLNVFLTICAVGRTEAYKLLDRKPPPSSLIGITPLSSIGLQVLLVALIQVIAIITVWQQTWYKPHEPGAEDTENLASHDNYAVFAASVFQYITLAVVFSKGSPYRKAIYSNRKNRVHSQKLISFTRIDSIHKNWFYSQESIPFTRIDSIHKNRVLMLHH